MRTLSSFHRWLLPTMLLALIVPTGAFGQLGIFPGPIVVDSPGGPESVTSGDFTGDGVADLVATAVESGHLVVLEGMGDGNFLAPRPFPVGGSPIRVSAVDLDQDGKLDVVWLDQETGDLKWAYGTELAQGAFERVSSLPEGEETAFVEVVDLGADGWPDVVVAVRGADGIAIHRNDGAGVLLPAVGYDSGDFPIQVRSAFWPGATDPHLFVVQAGVLSRDIGVYTGSNPVLTQRLLGESPRWLDVGNWNDDGIPDLIALTHNGGQGEIFVGQPGGGLVPDRQWPVADGSIALSWLDPIGNLRRVATSETGHGRIGVYQGVPGQQGMVLQGGYFIGEGIGQVVTAPLDALEGNELIVPLLDEDRIAILLRFGAGYRAYRSVITGAIPSEFDWIDATADHEGKLAALVAAAPTLRIYEPDQGVLAETQSFNPAGGADQLLWSYLDDDAWPELLVLYSGAGVDVYPGSPIGLGAPTRLEFFDSINHVETGDPNGDGFTDLILADDDRRAIRVLHGDGSMGFTEAPSIPTAVEPQFVHARDMDLDGYDDLLMLDGTNFLYLFFARPAGGFESPQRPTVGVKPTSIITGRFNADALPDIAVINLGGGGTFTVLRSVFSRVYEVSTSSEPTPGGANSAVALDANNDNNLDLAIVSPSSRAVAIHLGTGNGHFSIPIQFRCGTLPLDLAGGDLDGDGLGDLMVLDGTSESINMMFQDPSPPLAAEAWTLSGRRGSEGVELTAWAPRRPVVVRDRDQSRLPVSAQAEGVWSAVDKSPGPGNVAYTLLDDSGRSRDRLVLTGTVEPQESLLRLAPPYPNPSRGDVEIRFRSHTGVGDAELIIVDVAGRRIRTLAIEDRGGGWYGARWSGTDGRGQSVARGRYFAELRVGGSRSSAPIVHLGR